MGEFTGKAIAIWPQSPALIRKLNGMLTTDMPSWRPSIEHSPTTCDSCGLDCWIGPKQKELADSPLIHIVKLCIFCVAKAQRELNLSPKVIDVNMDADQIPRRT